MADKITYVHAGDIISKGRRDDGVLEFAASKATGSDMDIDEQVCDEAWLKKAMPEWMATGNIREQHSTIAAGIATALEERPDGHYISGLVVDAGSAKKVELGVLKGLSIGIKRPRVIKDEAAPGGRIVDGTIVEVSLVDYPANPTCKLTLAKAAGSKGELVEVEELVDDRTDEDKAAEAELVKEVAVLEPETLEVPEDPEPVIVEPIADPEPDPESPVAPVDPATPADEPVEPPTADEVVPEPAPEPDPEVKAAEPETIRNVTDLRKAIKTVDADEDPVAAKLHIRKRAEALHRSDLIPASWTTLTSRIREILATDPTVLLSELQAAKGITPDVTKDGEAAGIADARKAIAGLIVGEANEMLADPDEDESYCITYLLDALRCLRMFESIEVSEGEIAPNYAEVSMTTAADLVKVLTADDDESSEARDDIFKALVTAEFTASIVDAVKASITEDQQPEVDATKAAADERYGALEERLAKVEEMAAPGGPVLAHTTAVRKRAGRADDLRAEAEYNRRMATEVADNTLRTGYLTKAARLDAEASHLAEES